MASNSKKSDGDSQKKEGDSTANTSDLDNVKMSIYNLQFVNSFEIVNKYSEAKRKRLKFDFLICFSSENTRMVFNNK